MKLISTPKLRNPWQPVKILMVIIMGIVFWGLITDAKIQAREAIYIRDIFWFILIGILPALIMVAPLVWRNICPLSTANLLHFSLFHRKRLQQEGVSANQPKHRAHKKIYEWWKRNGTIISALLFWIIVPHRITLFNDSSIITFWIFFSFFIVALLLGALFPVKSGWCTSICPLFSIEKMYSINPAIHLDNKRCDYIHNDTINSCSGCSSHCIDVIDPEHAYWQESQHQTNTSLNAEMRKIFISTFPGFVLGYFLSALIITSNPGILFIIQEVILFSTIAGFMLATRIIYLVIKSWGKQYYHHLGHNKSDIQPQHREKLADFWYERLKRRLHLIFAATGWNIFYIFSSLRVSHIIVSHGFGVANSIDVLAGILLYSIFACISFLWVIRGWNETHQPYHYKTSWW